MKSAVKIFRMNTECVGLRKFVVKNVGGAIERHAASALVLAVGIEGASV